MASLCLGESAPDAIGLPDRHRVVTTIALYRTDLTHGFRTYLSSFSLVLALLSARWEEKMGMISAAKSRRLPGTI